MSCGTRNPKLYCTVLNLRLLYMIEVVELLRASSLDDQLFITVIIMPHVPRIAPGRHITDRSQLVIMCMASASRDRCPVGPKRR